jgi:hypothetical protein
MTKLTESAIETFTIKLFEKLGYGYIHAPDIIPDGEYPKKFCDTRALGCRNRFRIFNRLLVGHKNNNILILHSKKYFISAYFQVENRFNEDSCKSGSKNS